MLKLLGSTLICSALIYAAAHKAKSLLPLSGSALT